MLEQNIRTQDRIGYARVSTEDQRLDLQVSALKAAGCRRIFKDHGVSGGTMRRAGLSETLAEMKAGQTLVVWKLDRLGRSLTGLVDLIHDLGRREIGLLSLTEAIDTSSPGGRLMFHLIAALAEFERSLISERTKAGLEAARERGSQLGRPALLTTETILEAWEDVTIRGRDLKSVAQSLKVSPRTLSRSFKRDTLCHLPVQHCSDSTFFEM